MERHTPKGLRRREAVVIYKRSRFSYASLRGTSRETALLTDHSNDLTRRLFEAHEKNLACIEQVRAALRELGIGFSLLCRSELSVPRLMNKIVISVGGDGTLLDTSHYCKNSWLLGVNSDPKSSMGALCTATADDFAAIMHQVIDGELEPSPIARLFVKIGKRECFPLALNDVLFCHKNPASMSRFFISRNGETEEQRSSGIWIATAAGSTGGIFSSGADPLPLLEDAAIFRSREPYWVGSADPHLLSGRLLPGHEIRIRCNMMDGRMFIDGPHNGVAIALGDEICISIAKDPLWLIVGSRLIESRKLLVEKRMALRRCYGS